MAQTFNNIICQLVDSMEQSIISKVSSNMEKEKICQGYKEYLVLSYQPVVSEQQHDKDNTQQLFTFLLDTEKQRWANSTIEEIRSLLLPDENFFELQRIAEEVFSKALHTATTKIAIENNNLYQKLFLALNMNAEKVEDFNKNNADEILSNALLDLGYAFGKSDVTSLRLSHYI